MINLNEAAVMPRPSNQISRGHGGGSSPALINTNAAPKPAPMIAPSRSPVTPAAPSIVPLAAYPARRSV